MIGMKRNLRQTLEIAETVSDPRIKLQARAIVNDCYKYIMDLTTNGVIVNDALRFIQSRVEKLNDIHKLDEKIDAIEEGTTTNGVF
jgi:ribosome recycling factor